MLNVVDSGKRLLDRLLGAILNRLDLFSVEVREEVIRVIQLLLLVSGAIFFTAIGLVVGTFTLMLLVWDHETLRAIFLIGFTFLYLGAAAWAGLRAKSMIERGHLPFEETLNQLRKDRECLKLGP
ncbi:MAG: phage holin family protein [Verrucomicrobiia bacterium]